MRLLQFLNHNSFPCEIDKFVYQQQSYLFVYLQIHPLTWPTLAALPLNWLSSTRLWFACKITGQRLLLNRPVCADSRSRWKYLLWMRYETRRTATVAIHACCGRAACGGLELASQSTQCGSAMCVTQQAKACARKTFFCAFLLCCYMLCTSYCGIIHSPQLGGIFLPQYKSIESEIMAKSYTLKASRCGWTRNLIHDCG